MANYAANQAQMAISSVDGEASANYEEANSNFNNHIATTNESRQGTRNTNHSNTDGPANSGRFRSI